MALGVMGFMNAALGFLFLAIVYLSSSIRAVWVTPHGGYGQRESASIRGKCQPPGETPARPGDRFAIIRDPFSLTIPCHPGERRGTRQKKRRRPRRLPGAAVHEQLHGDCAERPSRLCARGEQGLGDAPGHRVGHRRVALLPSWPAAVRARPTALLHFHCSTLLGCPCWCFV